MCQVPECKRPSATRMGYCVMHYKRWKRNGVPERTLAQYSAGAVCTHCGKAGPLRKGHCKACSIRRIRKGYVERDVAPAGAGTTTKAGYRLITVEGKRVYEHRYFMGAQPGEIVHHEDRKDNNNADYLIVFPDQAAHMKHHAEQRKTK